VKFPGLCIDAQDVVANLLSAPVVAFVVAILATLARFELRLPDALPPVLSTFLLFAIGLKGGRSLAAAVPAELVGPLVVTLAVGVLTPLIAFVGLRGFVRLSRPDAAGAAAHYGSVSIVTFVAGTSLLGLLGVDFDGYMIAVTAIMDRANTGGFGSNPVAISGGGAGGGAVICGLPSNVAQAASEAASHRASSPPLPAPAACRASASARSSSISPSPNPSSRVPPGTSTSRTSPSRAR
jgi:hypothetical protein